MVHSDCTGRTCDTGPATGSAHSDRSSSWPRAESDSAVDGVVRPHGPRLSPPVECRSSHVPGVHRSLLRLAPECEIAYSSADDCLRRSTFYYHARRGTSRAAGAPRRLAAGSLATRRRAAYCADLART